MSVALPDQLLSSYAKRLARIICVSEICKQLLAILRNAGVASTGHFLPD